MKPAKVKIGYKVLLSNSEDVPTNKNSDSIPIKCIYTAAEINLQYNYSLIDQKIDLFTSLCSLL